MKKILVIVLTLIVLCEISFSIKTINVTETEVVNLIPHGYDPDSDPVTYSFTEPLDEYGRWETTYGDVGKYKITVTASDGELSTSEVIELIVKKKEEMPVIDSYLPEGGVNLDEGSTEKLEVNAHDLNEDPLIYTWFVDGVKAGESTSFIYSPTYFDAGEHTIKVIVSDLALETEKEWSISVNKVDRSKLLDNFKDLEVMESETVKLDLPDFKKYNLGYAISEPVGDDGIWETDYNDAGVHTVIIMTEDGDFNIKKDIKITVRDKDRPPVFVPVRNVRLKENQKVEIKLNASDPDGDSISFSAENMPEGAEFRGNSFIWQTDYDTVKKEGLMSAILDKFHLLSKSFTVVFIARSKELETRKKVKITVLDVNRAPVLDMVDEITINEGDMLEIGGKANDPDGDKISYSCSGWINKCEYQTNHNDAGVYTVKVIASDSFLSASKDVTVKVNNVNREPSLLLKNQTAREGEKLEVTADATDPDDDKVTINVLNLPKNASFENNVLSWTPPFNVTGEGSTNLTISFSASDEAAKATKDMVITVYNKNRAPKIIDATPIKEFTTYTGNQIRFEVVAEDRDNDALNYKWKFGLFEEYNATSVHLRTFATPGMKNVKVIISDDELKDSFEWRVNVLSYEDYLGLFK